MIFPIESLLAEHRELGLLLAVLIGFGFGFVLERAGFGRAKKLAAQFYLYDMTVFKVMFSAIVTSLLGVVVLSGFGVADLQAISDYATSGTFLWPMLIGGLLLGAGFIIAGYCPGTSLVAAASGNMDGLLTFGGVILGALAYNEALDALPALLRFHSSGNMGQLYLYDWVGIPAPVLTAAVVLMAIGCFVGAEKVEDIFRKKLEGRSEGVVRTDSNPTKSPERRVAFGAFGTLAAFSIMALVVPQKQTVAAAPVVISASELAKTVLETPWKLRILDVRQRASCAKSRIPGSECVPEANLSELQLQYAPAARDLVLVGDGDLAAVPAAASRYPGPIKILSGGYSAWSQFALTEPVFPGQDADEEALREFQLRSALHAALTGMKQAPPPPPAPSSGGGFKKKAGGGGCSG